MVIHTSTASFLIESSPNNLGCVSIQCTSELELYRFFGSLTIQESKNPDFPFAVNACKQEFSNALILMVKEIDYADYDAMTEFSFS